MFEGAEPGLGFGVITNPDRPDSERYIACTQSYQFLSRTYQMPPIRSLTLEEMSFCYMQQRYLPPANQEEYDRYVERYMTVSTSRNKAQLPAELRDRMMITSVCPRSLFLRINLVLISTNRKPLPTAGRFDQPENFSGKYLGYVAHSLGVSEYVGTAWAPLRYTDRFGTYIEKMTRLYHLAYAKLATNFVNFRSQNTVKDFTCLMALARVKNKTAHQDYMSYYMEGQRDQNDDKRHIAYYNKLDEVIKKAYINHQAHACLNNLPIRKCSDFTFDICQLIKLVTEFCVAEFPLPRNRLLLLNNVARDIGLFPLNEYVMVLGAMLYFGTITNEGLVAYDQPPELVEQASAIKDGMIANYGHGTAVYFRKRDKNERLNSLLAAGSEISVPNPFRDDIRQLQNEGHRPENPEDLFRGLEAILQNHQQPPEQLEEPEQQEIDVDNEEEAPDLEELFA